MRLTFAKSHFGRPGVSVFDNVIYIVGRVSDDDITKRGVYLCESKDNGRSWGEPFIVYIASTAWHPKLDIYQGTMNIVWCDERDGYYESEIYFIRSDDGGKTWGDEISVSSTSGDSVSPDILADNNGIHVIWEEREEYPIKKVYYTRSEDGGISWTADSELAEGMEPCFLGDGNDIFVLFGIR